MRKIKLRLYQVVAIAFVLVSAAFFTLSQTTWRGLYDQRAAEYWSQGSDSRWAQISVFFGKNSGIAYANYMQLLEDLTQRYESSNTGLTRWFAGTAIAFRSGQVVRGDITTNAEIIGVTGDYFLFHPPRMLAGSTFPSDALSKDTVLLDWETAWRLFGGYDVAGMTVEIGSVTCTVTGVFEKDASDPADYRVIMSFELLETLGVSDFSVLEFIAYEPVQNYGVTAIEELLSTPEADRVVVTNSSRFGTVDLLRTVADYETFTAQTKAVALPFWENTARAATVRAAVFLLAAIAFAVYPVVAAVVMFIVFLWRRSKNKKPRDLYY